LALLEGGQWKKFLAQYEGDFSQVVPEHIKVPAFVAMAAAYVRRDPKLVAAAMANPASFVLALRECAALGHLPMRGSFSLVPFNDSRAPGGKSIVGVEEYRGVIERMYRAGGVQSVHVEVVREKDLCRFQKTRMVLPDHEYDEFASDEERGPLKAVYAWARMHSGGTSEVAWLPRGQVLKHRAASRSGDSFWGPAWPGEGPWTQDMWKKTALHVLERFVPTSSAYRMEVARSEAAASTGFTGVPDRSPRQPAYFDAEVVEESAPVPVPDESGRSGPTGAGAPPETAATDTGTGWPKVSTIPNGGQS
jgi:recombination protein RecT